MPSHLTYEGCVLPIHCTRDAAWLWGQQYIHLFRANKFYYEVRSRLQHGTRAIEEFLRVTADSTAEVNPEMAADVFALAQELDSETIQDRAQQAMEKLYIERTEFVELFRLKFEHQLSSDRAEETISREPSFQQMLSDPRIKSIDLPILHRLIKLPHEPNARLALFKFFVDCLDDQFYGPRASSLFLSLDWTELTDEQIDVAVDRGFDVRFMSASHIHRLLSLRRQLTDELSSRDESIRRFESARVIAERTEMDLRHQIDEKTHEITEQELTIRMVSAELETLRSETAGEISLLQQRIEEQTSELSNCHAIIGAKNTEIEQKTGEVTRCNRRISGNRRETARH
jgi:hypothetical protein